MTATDTTNEPRPDGAAFAADLTCPLCGYNLRGLAEPRCPECGFTFQWAELLDEQRTRHPWLFEHGRGRNVRVFLATYVRTCRPNRFWQGITPANPVRLGRLALYWLLVSLPLLLSVAAFGLATVPAQVTEMAARAPAERAPYLPLLATGASVYLPRTNYRGPLTAAALDAEYPSPWSATFVFWAWSHVDLRLKDGTGPMAVAAVAFVVWPWLTAAALLLFQKSMRRAKVRPAHVLRVAIYGCDFNLLLAATAALLIAVAKIADSMPSLDRWGWDLYKRTGLEERSLLVVFLVLTAAAVAAYRTGVAYRRYLRFHWPVPTVLAAQAIVALAALAALAKFLIG